MDAMDLLERALEGVPEQTLEIVGADGARQAQPLSRGRGRMERFALYPGAELTRCDYLAEAAPCRHAADGHILEINYCRAGRAGWKLRDGTAYLGAGDCALHSWAHCADSLMSFPNGAYRGLSIAVDPARLAEAPPELIAQADIDVEALARRFTEGGFYRLPGAERLAHVFLGFFDQPPAQAVPMARLKFQELLFCLSRMERRPEGAPRHSAEQVETIRRVHDHLTRHLDARETIEELSRRFLMNPSTLKEVFRDVYGNSIAAHIREHRMERAAALLRETDMSMAEIARAVGYESPSKFSAEFRKAFNRLPTQYRASS